MAALLPLFRRVTHRATAATDRELLTRFAHQRDEEAFAELVHRYGPVVYRICSRLVGPHGAEDAFQAVFLVLATRFRAAHAAPSVAGWLVGVAGRVARQVRRAARRRARHETAAAEARSIEQADRPNDWSDQFRVLDEELAQLPPRLRDPVVLCLLRGHTQDEAAAELGHTARTLRRHLERAKRVLRARLERRGVVPAVAGALLAGAGAVSATTPSDLTRRTVATVFDFLTGGTAAAGSAPVVLAKGVATTMFTRNLVSLTVAATVGLIGLGVVFAGDGPPNAPPTPVPARGPMPAALGRPAPVQPPVLPAVTPPLEIDWKKDEAQARALLAQWKAALRGQQPDKTVVSIQALCVRVPAGFCERSGLTAEESAASGAWFLSRREQRMFSSLLRAEPGTEIVSRPQLQVEDGQTGHVKVGQAIAVVTDRSAETKDGKTADAPEVKFIDVGVQLKITPRIAASGHLLLQIETQSTEVAGSKVNLGGDPPVYAPAFNVESCQSTVVVPDAGTVVFRGAISAAAGKKARQETLWVLTPHLVRNDKSAVTPDRPAPKPSPAMPPAAPTPPTRP